MHTTSLDQASRCLHTTGPGAHRSWGLLSLVVRNTDGGGDDGRSRAPSRTGHTFRVSRITVMSVQWSKEWCESTCRTSPPDQDVPKERRSSDLR
jgi:hypothetical protein